MPMREKTREDSTHRTLPRAKRQEIQQQNQKDEPDWNSNHSDAMAKELAEEYKE